MRIHLTILLLAVTLLAIAFAAAMSADAPARFDVSPPA
jgi:hypothetical protein